MIQSIENGRKEDGNRSIADKIIKRLHDLDKTVESNQGRWAWELLQNAKDSVANDGRSVDVQIFLDEGKVEFRHNGTHFTEQDVRGIINQISSKEIEEGEPTKKTGRFGTGFLTTHLLSRVVEIKGIVQAEDNKYYSFEFPLNRVGKTTTELAPKVETAWKSFQASTVVLPDGYNQGNFNTSFSYQLDTEPQKKIAKTGILEFQRLIPFVLAFIPRIRSVEILNHLTSQNILFERGTAVDEDFIVPVQKKENGIPSDIFILFASDSKVSIASELEKTKKGYAIKNNKDIPKLFCDFPLIGTEKFHFPVIVNSFYFNPQTERDGIWLRNKKEDNDIEVTENQNLLLAATELFRKLIPKLEAGNFFKLFNVANTATPIADERYFDSIWYKDNIQKKMREILVEANFIELEGDVAEKKSLKEIWFPLKVYSKAVQDRIWSFNYDMFPESVCKKDHLQEWCNLSWDEWNKLSYAELINDIVKLGSITKLKEALNKDNQQTFDWLNNLRQFILEEETNLSLFENSAITPNQKGVLLKKSELRLNHINDDDLIEILALLGEDWKDKLIHKATAHGIYFICEKKDIADKISEKLKNHKNDENSIKAICLLSEWFENNDPDVSRELFHDLFRKKAELFMSTIRDKESLYKVMRSNTDLAKLAEVAKALEDNPALSVSIEEAAQLNSLYKEFNVGSIAELKELLLRGISVETVRKKIEIDESVLIGLGVTSLDELEEALRDKDLATLFKHSSTPNADLFLFVHGLISRSKKNVIEHLKTLDQYDCSDMEELAPTVIGGIRKDGLLIHVVVRPCDNGDAIIYYNSEKDTLDYANAELWVENGHEVPRLLTLGKILKNTGINKIPVK